MQNQLAELNKLNSDGNLVVATQKNGGVEVQTVKYGLVQLFGQKQERRVSFQTLLNLEKAQKSGADQPITVRELSMTVYPKQIVMLRSETEQVRKTEGYTNLPTESKILDENMEFSPKIRTWHCTNCVPFYQAKIHYREGEDGREYIMDFEKMPELLRFEFRDGCPVITQIIKYGERIR